MFRVLSRALVLVLLALPLASGPMPVEHASPPVSRTGTVPVYAYFYQWYQTSSWRRAKIDYPLAGRYSSDNRQVLDNQIAQAQGAGIDGFLTSWKSTPALNRRLSMLLQQARRRHFDVGIVYEGLNYQRHPLPIARVRSDMAGLVTRWGGQLRSRHFGRPIIIWTGIAQYSLADIRSVRRVLGDRAYLLASAKSTPQYNRVAGLVDGDAYYWSSANPGTTYTRTRLETLGESVHHHHGIWLAPATPGFDGRPLGHTRVIPRDGGRTLAHSLSDAFASKPDAVGVISWNEWSENTYIEPGRRYGSQELDVLRRFLRQRRTQANTGATPTHARTAPPRGSTPPASSRARWAGLTALLLIAAASAAAVPALVWRLRSRGRDGPHG